MKDIFFVTAKINNTRPIAFPKEESVMVVKLMNNYTLIAIDKTNNTTYTHKRMRNYFSNCNFNLGTLFFTSSFIFLMKNVSPHTIDVRLLLLSLRDRGIFNTQEETSACSPVKAPLGCNRGWLRLSS